MWFYSANETFFLTSLKHLWSIKNCNPVSGCGGAVRSWFERAAQLKKKYWGYEWEKKCWWWYDLMILPTTVTIHTSTYVKPEIHTADMRKVIMNHFFQKPLLQSGMVRNSRVMMGRDKTQRIRFMSLSGMANTLLCSDGKQEERLVFPLCIKNTGSPVTTKVCCYLRESHWGHAGWETGESTPSRLGRCRCLFWSGCGLADWCRCSSPSGAVPLSSRQILCPDRCSKDSASSAQTHWCEDRSTEPRCRPRRPAAGRRRRTCEIKHAV